MRENLEIEAVEGFLVDVQVYMNEIMVHKGVSRYELASRMNVSRKDIDKMFDDCSNITVRDLARVAFFLGENPRVESETTRLLRQERENESSAT